MIADEIYKWTLTRGVHSAGTLGPDSLRALERHCKNLKFTVETGCGASTVLFSRLSDKHYSFCFDDRNNPKSSVDFVTSAPLYNPDSTTFFFGANQRTLPGYQFEESIEFALIDGPHGYPFPELEYYALYPYLKEGSILAIDDVHIPTIHNLFKFLSEDDMFDFVERAENLAIFRRTAAPTFDPFGDGWDNQKYNARRFPMFGREDRWARVVPKWLTHLFPQDMRKAVKRALARE